MFDRRAPTRGRTAPVVRSLVSQQINLPQNEVETQRDSNQQEK